MSSWARIQFIIPIHQIHQQKIKSDAAKSPSACTGCLHLHHRYSTNKPSKKDHWPPALQISLLLVFWVQLFDTPEKGSLAISGNPCFLFTHFFNEQPPVVKQQQKTEHALEIAKLTPRKGLTKNPLYGSVPHWKWFQTTSKITSQNLYFIGFKLKSLHGKSRHQLSWHYHEKKNIEILFGRNGKGSFIRDPAIHFEQCSTCMVVSGDCFWEGEHPNHPQQLTMKQTTIPTTRLRCWGKELSRYM